MYFWLKVLHIGAMAVWFSGLVLLPRLLAARHREGSDADPAYFNPVAKTLYLSIMSPAGLLAIALGAALIAYGPQGAWLVLKLVLVALAVLLHLYVGVILYAVGRERERHGPWTYRAMGWLPLLLLLGLAALTGAKPATVGDLPPPPGTAEAEPVAAATDTVGNPAQAGGVASSGAPARSSSRSP